MNYYPNAHITKVLWYPLITAKFVPTAAALMFVHFDSLLPNCDTNTARNPQVPLSGSKYFYELRKQYSGELVGVAITCINCGTVIFILSATTLMNNNIMLGS